MKTLYIGLLTGLLSIAINAQDVNLEWAKQMGGINNDQGNSIVIDALGNVYTTGQFRGTADFDPGTEVFNLTSAGDRDIFISKLNASGDLVWAEQFGGNGSDFGSSVMLDASGNIYTTGGIGITPETPNVFIQKRDGFGNELWTKQFGGIESDAGSSVKVDVLGNVYTTGGFSGTVDFDPGTGTYSMTSLGARDMFISKLNASGDFVWAKQIGGNSWAGASSLVMDDSGNLYFTGYFSGTTDFDPGTEVYNLTSIGHDDIFISKLDSSGDFVWAKQMGGPDIDFGFSVKVDALGNVNTTGEFKGTADFDPGSGTYNLTSAGDADIFISKLDTSGNFVWAKQIGGTDQDWGRGIEVDVSGNVYTTGFFLDIVDFDPGTEVFNLTSVGGSKDIFISKLDASGNFLWANQIGGADYDVSKSIAIDASGNVYVTGTFQGTADFDPGIGTYNLTALDYDIFVLKLSQSSTGLEEPPWPHEAIISPNPNTGKFSITTDMSDYQITIHDLTGKLISAKKDKKNHREFDMSEVGSGVYFIRLFNSETVLTEKIIVE